MGQAGWFGLSDQLKRLSGYGDPLDTMVRLVDFEMFRPALEKALAYGDGARGARPPYDPVTMFRVLILAAQNIVSDARMDPSTSLVCLGWCNQEVAERGGHPAQAADVRPFDRLVETPFLSRATSVFPNPEQLLGAVFTDPA